MITFLFLGYAFFKIYKKSKDVGCQKGSFCADPKADKLNKTILWSVTALIVGMLIFPNIIGAISSNLGHQHKQLKQIELL